jgi:hypothetical protein
MQEKNIPWLRGWGSICYMIVSFTNVVMCVVILQDLAVKITEANTLLLACVVVDTLSEILSILQCLWCYCRTSL